MAEELKKVASYSAQGYASRGACGDEATLRQVAVQAWLQRDLARRYDGALNESLPGELRDLLDVLH